MRKNQGNSMCSVLEKRLRARQREKEREETVFNGPNSPSGRRTNKYLNFLN